MGRLEAYLEYYCEGLIKESLGWLSPMECGRKLGNGTPRRSKKSSAPPVAPSILKAQNTSQLVQPL